MSSFLAALNDEWAELSTSRRARRKVARWAERHPVLRGLADPAAVLRRRSSSSIEATPILAALAALAPADDLAARTLLHALMPGIVKAARRASAEDPLALEEMVSLAWERIRTYPTTRNGSVAANVLWDVHKRYWQHREIEAPRSASLPAGEPGCRLSAEDEALDNLALGMIASAFRRGVVDEPAFQLIVRTRFAGVPLRELAREQRLSSHVLAQRRLRAERALLREMPLAG
jgi:hypothetical protein